MSKTITIEGHIHARRRGLNGELAFTFFSAEDMAEHGYLHVCPHVISAEVPEGFNPVTAEVGALLKERDRLRNEFNARVKQINDRLANLQCLEFSPEVVA